MYAYIYEKDNAAKTKFGAQLVFFINFFNGFYQFIGQQCEKAK